ncbi:MAG TPA: hypothetical protein VMI52_05345, partial [Acetobacteraceae bacterium]|nr:hypothetical protein [Acetobacteraceae bacterium]
GGQSSFAQLSADLQALLINMQSTAGNGSAATLGTSSGTSDAAGQQSASAGASPPGRHHHGHGGKVAHDVTTLANDLLSAASGGSADASGASDAGNSASDSDSASTAGTTSTTGTTSLSSTLANDLQQLLADLTPSGTQANASGTASATSASATASSTQSTAGANTTSGLAGLLLHDFTAASRAYSPGYASQGATAALA